MNNIKFVLNVQKLLRDISKNTNSLKVIDIIREFEDNNADILYLLESD